MDILIQQADDKINAMGNLFDGDFRYSNIRGILTNADTQKQLGEEDCRRLQAKFTTSSALEGASTTDAVFCVIASPQFRS